MNRLELLLQIELALILEERAANLPLDLALETQDLDLGGERVREMREERADVRGLQIFLPLLESHEHVRGDRERLLLARLRPLHERHHFGGQAAMQRDVLLEERDDAPRHRALVGAARGLVEREGRHDRAKHLVRRCVARHLRARDALDEHLRRAVRAAARPAARAPPRPRERDRPRRDPACPRCAGRRGRSSDRPRARPRRPPAMPRVRRAAESPCTGRSRRLEAGAPGGAPRARSSLRRA